MAACTNMYLFRKKNQLKEFFFEKWGGVLYKTCKETAQGKQNLRKRIKDYMMSLRWGVYFVLFCVKIMVKLNSRP